MKAPRPTPGRDDDRGRLSPRRKGVIVGLALASSLALGGTVLSTDDTASVASACTPVLAGRAGTLPCERHDTKADQTIEKIIGTTVTGCVVGFTFGMGAGLLPGCLGGLVGNIAW